jgi:sentrin-specific protease 1
MGLLYKDGEVDYERVKRYTSSKANNVDIRGLNKVFAPINVNDCHWTLAVINFVTNEIMYYDSLSRHADPGAAHGYLEAVKTWVNIELKTKRAKNVLPWTLVNVGLDGPQQVNGCDCGVYVMMTADFLCDDLSPHISPEDINFFRRKIQHDVVGGELRYSHVASDPDVRDRASVFLSQIIPELYYKDASHESKVDCGLRVGGRFVSFFPSSHDELRGSKTTICLFSAPGNLEDLKIPPLYSYSVFSGCFFLIVSTRKSCI